MRPDDSDIFEGLDSLTSLRGDRQIVIVTGAIALVAAVGILTGAVYLTNHIKSKIASFEAAANLGGTRLPVAQESNEVESRPNSTPWTSAAAQAYAMEQSNRAVQLRQADHARQLEETRRANQQIIDDRTRAQQQRRLVADRSPGQEFTVPLGTFTRVTLGGTSYRVAVHDDGPDEIRVLIDDRSVVRFQKHNGFEGREIETLIFSNGSGHLYYLNEISDHVGHCKLRLRDE